MQEGRSDEACARFAESLALSRSIAALLNLGLCNRASGRLATALSYLRQAEQLSAEAGDAERGAKAAADALQLEALVGRLTVRVSSPSDAELRIEVDGVELPRDRWATAIPTDAGSHQVIARSRDERRFDVTVSDGASSVVTISAAPPPAPASPRRPALAAVPATKPAPAVSGGHVATYVLGGLGFVSIGVGLGFGVAAWRTYAAAEARCPQHVNCVPSVAEQYSTAVTDATVANVAVGVGLGAVAAGAILYILQGKPRRDSTTQASLFLSPASSGIEGRF